MSVREYRRFLSVYASNVCSRINVHRCKHNAATRIKLPVWVFIRPDAFTALKYQTGTAGHYTERNKQLLVKVTDTCLPNLPFLP